MTETRMDREGTEDQATLDRPQDDPRRRRSGDTGIAIDDPQDEDLTGREITTGPGGQGGDVRIDPDRAG